MRFAAGFAVVLCLLGSTLSSPVAKRIEKKSISNHLAPSQSIEPAIDTAESKILGDDALIAAEGTGDNTNRPKKSTTFCVEIRQDKPTPVDCDDHKPVIEEVVVPDEPEVSPPSTPAPEPVLPVQPPHPAIFVLPPSPPQIIVPGGGYPSPQPCEPEMGPIMVQPPPQVVLGPTGNCAGQAGGNYGVLPSFSGNLPGINAGSLPGFHANIQPGGLPSYFANVYPSHGGLHGHPHPLHKPHHGLPLNHPPHGIHPGGIACTCKQVQPLLTVLGREANNNQALAQKLLNDLQGNIPAQMTMGSWNGGNPMMQIGSFMKRDVSEKKDE